MTIKDLTIGTVLRHKYQADRTAVVLATRDVYTRGVNFPFKTVISIKEPCERYSALHDIGSLRSNWKLA